MTTTSSTSTSTSSTTTASSLTTSSLVTQLGGGSGIDMTALANTLATAQFASRKANLDTQNTKLTAQISAASNLKSELLTLDTSLGTLVRSGSLAPTPSVANSTVATTSLSGSSTPSGSYSLEVDKLATNQQVATSAYASSKSTLGGGTLTLRFGTVSGSSFTEDTTHSAVDITIADGASLSDVAQKINSANAGVTAYISNTTSGAQLVLKGAQGASNGFVLEASDSSTGTSSTTSSSLSNLAWNPSAQGTGQLLQAAGDAAYKVDGLSMTSASNTITDAIPGVKMTLTGTNVSAPTTVSFADATETVASSMQDFVDALNTVVSDLNTATAIGGDLAGDNGARSLKQSLSLLASTTIMPNATGTAKTLGDLGLKLEQDGTFSLDSDRLTATLSSDPQGVAAMFTTGVYGVYASVDKIYRNTISTTDSNSLASSIARWTKSQTEVTSDESDLATQQETLRTQLVARFSASETRISSFNSTKSMLENQIAQWNKSS